MRQTLGGNEYSSGATRSLKARLGLGTPPASSLRTEVLGDGLANCLENAVKLAKPGDQVVLLADRRDGVGHAVVERPDGSIIDPNRPKEPYANLDAYLKEQDRYHSPARVSDVMAERILKTPPGPRRDAMISLAGLDKVASRFVADPAHITAQYTQQARQAATDAQAAWDRTIANGGSELEAARAAAQVLEDAASSKNDPEFRKHVARAAVDLADDIGRAVGSASDGRSGSEALLTTLELASRFAEAGSDEFTQALSTSMAEAMPDREAVAPFRGRAQDALHQVQSFLNRQASDGNTALAAGLASELGRLEKTTTLRGLAPALTDALSEVQGTFDEAQQRYLQAEAQLGVELQRFGPAMSDEEKKAYVEAFWAESENAGIKRDLQTAEAELAETFEATAPALEAAAIAGDRGAAEQLMRSVKGLASSQTHASMALDFVDHIGRTENKALFDALNHDGKLEDTIENDVMAPALGNAQAAALAGGQGDLDALIDKLKLIKTNATNFKRLAGAIGTVTRQYDTVKQLLAAGKTSEEISQALRLEDLTAGWEGKSKFGKALAVFGLVSAMGAAVSADGNLDRLQASLSVVKGGLELTAGVLSALGGAGKLASGTAAATFLSKLAPGVGLVIDSIQLYEDIQKIRDGGNVGDYISAFGTVVNLAGDIAGFVPVVGQLIDGPLTALGSVIQGVGGLVSMTINGNEEARENREEIDARLKAAGLSEAEREILLTERSIDATSIAALGLTGESYLAALEATAPIGSDDAYAIDASQRAWHIAAAYGLQGDDALHFVQDFTERYNNVEGFQTLQLLYPAIERFTMSAAVLAREGHTSQEIAAELGEEFGEMNDQLREILGPIYDEHLGGSARPVPGFYLPQFLNLPD
ncbi:MAG: hypothetical protein JNJ54_07915 [Myxococcaceae bacterium]|nr:hypothetical protein [Myxococcaceae bacterium]